MVLAHDISKGDRTRDVKITENITFETMLLAPETLEGLKVSGFYKPSPIQLYGIPIGKCGFDLLLEAKSGTGKTAVFTIIALEKLDFCKGLQVIILTPTREIAAQICDVLKLIGSEYKELRVEVVMGGLPLQDDIEKFKKPVHIVVGSPGRVKHLIMNKNIDVQSVRLLVLDEADKLMENSFQADIKFIHSSLPKQKQVIMSSATYPQSTKNLLNNYVQNASHVCPDSDCILLGIEQKVSFVKYNSNIIKYTQEKFKELHKILGRLQFKQCLVFCNYQVRVTDVHNMLKKAEWPSEKLYGQQEQLDRLDALKTLQQYKCRILVSTDLAARGIDSSNIDLVINFEPPYDWQTYLHRIGRAGRYGSYGLAVTILSEGKEQQKFRDMFRSTKLSIDMHHLWSDEKFNIDSVALTHTTKPDVGELSSESSTTLDGTEKISTKEIWDLLSGDNNVTNSIETFGSFCKFSDSSDIPKIEQFSELMQSLDNKNCEDTGEDIKFKHIEMKKTSINQSLIIQNPKNVKDSNINILKENKDDAANNHVTEKIDEMKLLSLTSPNTSQNEHNVSNDTPQNINKTDEQLDTNAIMLNYDLPVTFSSSKFKRHTKRSTQSINKNNFHSRDVNKNKDFAPGHISHMQKKLDIVETNGDTDKDPNYCLEKETHRWNTTTTGSHSKASNNYYEKKYKYNNPQKHSYSKLHNIEKNTPESFGQTECAKSYNDWYNQLKIRMKYIEQAIYLDEIPKF